MRIACALACACLALACSDEPANAGDPAAAAAGADPAATAAAEPAATEVIVRGADSERRGFRTSGDGPLEPIDPRSHVRYGDITVTGPLEELVARRMLRRYLTDLRACHTAALAAGADDAGGQLTLELALDTNGAVSSVRATDATVPAAIASCVEQRARAWQLAARPDASVVRATFSFTNR